MARSRSEKLLRTTDLTLATYLLVEGFDSELVEMEGEEVKHGHPQGAWEFTETPALQDAVDEFNRSEATVEPQAFHACLNATRREMFSYLDIGKG